MRERHYFLLTSKSGRANSTFLSRRPGRVKAGSNVSGLKQQKTIVRQWVDVLTFYRERFLNLSNLILGEKGAIRLLVGLLKMYLYWIYRSTGQIKVHLNTTGGEYTTLLFPYLEVRCTPFDGILMVTCIKYIKGAWD